MMAIGNWCVPVTTFEQLLTTETDNFMKLKEVKIKEGEAAYISENDYFMMRLHNSFKYRYASTPLYKHGTRNIMQIRTVSTGKVV